MIEAGNARAVEETTGYLLAKVCRAHRGSIGALLSGVGLHVGQEMVLLELCKEDGLKGGELADRLGVEPPTVTRMIRRMESCGFVERRPDPSDARSFRVHLTDKGRSLEEPVARIWEEVEEKTLQGISPEEALVLRRLLARIRKNLGSAGAGC
ncbi:MAG TPA: MarR family transcriptional regulator [Rubrobacteraceae bacterium]|nr:MarR family transcriptional regulator [Rubrobacteraceae bacterium]